MDFIHILVLEKSGRRTVSAHATESEVLAALRRQLRPADAHAGMDAEELYEILHGPDYALSIATERAIAPSSSTGRFTVLITESEDGPAISVYLSPADARSQLAMNWGVPVRDLDQEAQRRQVQMQLIGLTDPR